MDKQILKEALQKCRKKKHTQISLIGYAVGRTVYLNNRLLLPEKSLHIINRSSEGFNWGYSGSGSTQLAVGILYKLFGKTLCISLYSLFRDTFLANLSSDSFSVTIDLETWLERMYRESKGLANNPETITLDTIMKVVDLPIEFVPATIPQKMLLNIN